MKAKQITRRIMAYLLVLALITQFVITASAGTALAASAPTISKKSKDILVGEKYNFNINNKVKNSTYQWEISDTSVATVNNRGVVTAKTKGVATITCEVNTPSKKYLLTSKVNIRKPAETIEINNKIEKIYVGEVYNLNRTIGPLTSNDKTTWTTSDSTIAKPNKNGVFTALKPGQVVITANTISGEKDSVTIRVLDETNSLTLTKDSVIDGKIVLTDVSYDYIIIDNSVGKAEIILDQVTINDTLEMEADANYTVRAINSNINRVVSLEEDKAIVSSFSLDSEKRSVAPTFIAETGTLVLTVDARGNVTVKQEGKAEIGTVTVNRKIDGSISINLEGFQGNLVVNTTSNSDIDIVTNGCNIPETTIRGTSSGQRLSLSDNTANGAVSNIGKIIIESSANVNIDVPTTEMVIAETIKNASVTIEKPIENIINLGSATYLAVNSSVTNIFSSGDELTMKVEAGSTIKGIELAGNSSKVDVALGSTIENIVAKGNDSAITGRGKVGEVKVEGNNTKIDTSNVNVIVGENAVGTVTNGNEVPAGTVVAPTPSPNPPTNPSPTPGTGEKITISNPGDIWAGTDVKMTADYDNVRWSIYSYVNGTFGYATINPSTGVLSPISTGTVRVVATSNLNSEVYGAVDVVIQGKKFVRIEPIEDVIIDSNQGLIDINELMRAGILPKEANLVYETGKGSETETITVSLANYWFGDYDGSKIQNQILKCSVILPRGYERPVDLSASIIVKVRVSQSDNRIIINGSTPLETIILTNDENLVRFDDLYLKYFQNKDINLLLPGGGELLTNISGYYTDSGAEFNGAVPGTYNIELIADIPQGHINKYKYQNSNYTIMWAYVSDQIIPVTVIVQAVQTSLDDGYIRPIPATTQPKINPTQKVAIVESVLISGQPTEVVVGEIINFNDYLTVLTNTNNGSDQRVTWSCNGYIGNNINGTSGQYIPITTGLQRIRATSVIDKTKYSEVTINVVNGKSIKSFLELEAINVDEDKGIINLQTMYSALEDRLPKSLNAVLDTGENMFVHIIGWCFSDFVDNTMTITPLIDIRDGYIDDLKPSLTINLNTPQADNRVVVVSGSAITSTITLSEDRYATNGQYLKENLFHFDSNDYKIMINAILEDNSTIQLLCRVNSFYVEYENFPNYFNGSKGKAIIRLGLLLPEGYTAIGADLYNDLVIYQTVDITVDQTPRYEELWVSEKPTKMSYTEGETLDLTGILVLIRDTTQLENVSDIYIGVDKFTEYGLELHLDYPDGQEITSMTPLTVDMNNRYIYIFNTNNYTSAYIGAITVTE